MSHQTKKDNMSIRLMIADDHMAIRAGVVSLVRGTEIEVVCQAETVEQTVKFALAGKPDVLLLDIRMAGVDGLKALEKIKPENPSIAVLIFSSTEEVKDMAYARKLGADGYVSKGTSREDLLNIIRRAASGKSCWTTRQTRQVVSRAAVQALARGDRNPLSAREMQVLEKIMGGLSNEGISEALGIHIETVKQHVKHVLKKLHVEDRTQAALCLLRPEIYKAMPLGQVAD
jgi:DNA-binding NarL/FixJ family response regulator